MLTIKQGVQLAAVACFVGLLLAIWLGWRRVESAGRLPYYLLRRARVASGWRIILLGITLGAAGVALQFFGEPAVYTFITPTPSLSPTATITLTPTITLVPTITLTPSISPSPSITLTPTETGTPVLPDSVTLARLSSVTPDPQAVFGAIRFSTRLSYPAPNPAQEFTAPTGTIYGIFDYNFLDPGVPWTALWIHQGTVVCSETLLWEGPTGGYGFTECAQDPWLAGEYEVQMFVGETWKISGRFAVTEGLATAAPGTTTP